MKIRNYSARIILALWCSALAFGAPQSHPRARSAATSLADLVRNYRESPTPAERLSIENYATAHAKELNGVLARLALGVIAYQHKDYDSAVSSLRGLPSKLPQISDYAAYYLTAARVELKDMAGVAEALTPIYRRELPSPFRAQAFLLEARAIQAAQPAEAVRLLREHYADLPQPEGDITLADCYQAAGELAHAADFYQRVYYQYTSGDASEHAAAALAALKETMGAAYPQPLPQQMLQRAGRLLEARAYAQARGEYQNLVDRLTGVERDQARVRIGASNFLAGNTAAGYPYLRSLSVEQSEADAERLFYLEECARRLTDDDEMMVAVNRLGQLYPQSRWRLKALQGAANRYLVANRPQDYLPLYKAIYEDFSADPAAATSHWRLAFEAYLQDRSDAADLLREHLQKYPGHATAGAALYFLGRRAETDRQFAGAAGFYQRLAQAFPNTYYGLLARQRLSTSEMQIAPVSAPEFLVSPAPPDPKPVPSEALSSTTARIERSRLLRTAGLNDVADAELRYGARTDGQPALLAMEMATSAETPYQGLRAMKSLSSDYLSLPLIKAPEKYWQLLFPLPYRQDLVASANARDLDPYLVAGLVRQESEFNPQALSRANAYGLTQVIPATGRRYAGRAGVTGFTNRLLFQPAVNLKIGATVLRSMLDQNGGSIEQALASYNAGPNRVAQWTTWRTYREPAEFVESIPFTETREYVQAVLRNADIYHRIYTGDSSGATASSVRAAAIRRP